MYQRTVQGPPARADEGKELQQRRSRASTMSFDAGTAVAGGNNSKSGSIDDTYKDETASVLSANAELDDYRATLADAYEWMWYVGFNGTDPLMLDRESARAGSGAAGGAHKKRSKSTGGSSRPMSATHNQNSITSHNENRNTSPSSQPDPAAAAALSISDPQSLAAPEAEEDAALEHDFQEHFESSRMSVFASSSDHVDMLSSYVPDHLDSVGAGPSLNAINVSDGPIVESPDMNNWAESFAPFQDVPSPTPAHLNDTTAADQGATVTDVAPAGNTSPTVVDHTESTINIPVTTPRKAPSNIPPPAASSPSSPPSRHAKRARVDYHYPLEWIRTHVAAMEALAMELGSLVPLMKTAHKDHKSFRASALKKQAEWQALPVNLHYQLMSVRPYCPSNEVEEGTKVRTEVVHSVTCGAMTPHMLGHKKGGLYYQESKLVNSKVELDREKNAFVEKQHMAGNTGIPTAPTEPFGVYKRLQELGDKTLQFESVCLSICHRRAYAISQALSIAVNSLLLKLGLTIQGVIPERVAEQWLHCGVLLVFEGLLSVVAHERSMLEDTISAVDALRSFQVRLLPYPDEHHLHKSNTSGNQKPSEQAASSSGTKSEQGADHLDIDNISISVDGATTAAFASSNSTSSPENDNTNANPDATGDAKRSLKLELRGREVLVYVPHSSLKKFSQAYQQAAYHKGGAVIPLYSVLFTQVCAIM